MEKGRGLADLREADPLSRRLEVEKKELYAKALREQMSEAQRRKEMAASQRISRSGSKNMLIRSPGRVEVEATNTSASCPSAQSVNGSCDSSPRPSASPTTVTGCNSSPAVAVRNGLAATPSLPNFDATDKVAQLQDLMRARLRAVEEEQQQQWCRIQSALQDQTVAARDVAEQAAKRQVEVMQSMFDNRVESLQRMGESAGRNAEEAVRVELRRAQIDLDRQRQGDLEELRGALHEQAGSVKHLHEEVKDLARLKIESDQRFRRDVEEIRESLLEHAGNVIRAREEIRDVRVEADGESKLHQNYKAVCDTIQEQARELHQLRDDVRCRTILDSDNSLPQQRDVESLRCSFQNFSSDLQTVRKEATEAAEFAREAIALVEKLSSPCPAVEEVKTAQTAIEQRLQQIEQAQRRQGDPIDASSASMAEQLRTQLRASREETLRTIRHELQALSEGTASQLRRVQEAQRSLEESLQQNLQHLQDDHVWQNQQTRVTAEHAEELERLSIELRECRQLNDLFAVTATQLRTEHNELIEQERDFPGLVQSLREELTRQIGKLAVRVEMAFSASPVATPSQRIAGPISERFVEAAAPGVQSGTRARRELTTKLRR